jgi:hypothetical protein
VAYTVERCSLPSSFSAVATDCDDSDSGVFPGRAEICDGIDNNCDGNEDEGVLLTLYPDTDRDRYGDMSNPKTGCTASSTLLVDGTDCDDKNSAINPGATEVCDNMDNDCDGGFDDDDSSLDLTAVMPSYLDADGDGFGDSTTGLRFCVPPSDYTYNDQDCDDDDTDINPAAEEVCDEQDNNCDSAIDEDLLGSDAMCAALTCNAIYTEGLDDGDGLYWIDPDGDGLDAFEAYCDMSRDGGGWTRVFASQYPTFWSDTDFEDVGDPEDDDYSMLAWRSYFEDSAGSWTIRMDMGTSGTWSTATRAYNTIWSQAHDPFDDATGGSGYAYLSGDKGASCGGFNGLHNESYTTSGVYARVSDQDTLDSAGCWEMQVVPLKQFESAEDYPGYLEGYSRLGGVHTWQVLWLR